MKKRLIVSAAVLLASLPTASRPQDKPVPSPFDRLGGVYPISAVVDDFIDRVHVDATLNANPAVSRARAALRKPGLKFQVQGPRGRTEGARRHRRGHQGGHRRRRGREEVTLSPPAGDAEAPRPQRLGAAVDRGGSVLR
jgi:hypothetical protein